MRNPMKVNESGRQNCAVEQLSFGIKTSKRVTWEAWDFTIVSRPQVEVTNAGYGFLEDEHSYAVGIEDSEESA
jgi:hypothetical protein